MAEDKSMEANWTEKVDAFEKLNLKEDLLRGIFAYGFEKPSFIQQVGILPLIKQKDTIAQAQSGTGKTGAFSIGTLQIIDEKKLAIQALILAPARELAQQTARVIQSIGEYMEIKCHICTGGTKVIEDVKALNDGVHVVVGTPGRVLDLINKGKFPVQHIKILVLDEADQMLDKGFKEQMAEVIKRLPGDVQIGLYSATMPDTVLEVTKEFMRTPVIIRVKNEDLTLDGIKQFFVAIQQEGWKYPTLKELYKNIQIQQAIIYINKKKDADETSKKLKEDGFTLEMMHGQTPQEERDEIMRKFRKGEIRVLITTDLLARGLDVQQVSLVINYDLPQEKETYIHRIGRSGRFGRKGVAINLVTTADGKFMTEIEKFYNTQIEELPLDLSKIYE